MEPADDTEEGHAVQWELDDNLLGRIAVKPMGLLENLKIRRRLVASVAAMCRCVARL